MSAKSRTELQETKAVKGSYYNFGFHDDQLLGFTIDLGGMEAIFRIKTIKWIEDAPGIYHGRGDTTVLLKLKLERADNFFDCKLGSIVPAEILDAYVDGTDFFMALVLSDFHCKITGYEIQSEVK